ncbi:D-alanine--D-alanine ligase family protein [Thalassoroseus pseudoceratinae]|uniref:D-alanine--D-alanine ligase family protein n=1 Tax=Thalassoroseus pseudoceratinae TaxID=2713176 RepID=UPI001420414A|nr:D-alanine--D-alanine ligase [Thalassoroseus pseudoceratinae]
MTTLANRRIVVLGGGASAERDISLASGRAVLTALRICGHHVVWLDPHESKLTEFAWEPRDVAFNALHGEFGEDGGVQRILESLGVPLTGCDSVAAELTFSKSACKERFRHARVPTPESVVIHQSDDAERIEWLARNIGFPLVVKPDRQGSSLGVSIVQSAEELPAALTECFHFGKHGLLESFVDGTEWTVGILPHRTLPPVRIETPRSFYDFEAKYSDSHTRYEFAEELPPRVLRHLEYVAAQAAESVGIQELSRVDLRLDRHLEPWVLEINAVPGLTDHSLIPKAARKVGLSLGELCEQALNRAIERVPLLHRSAA